MTMSPHGMYAAHNAYAHAPLSPSAPPFAPPAVASLPMAEPPPPPSSEAPEIRTVMHPEAPPPVVAEAVAGGMAESWPQSAVTINDVLGPTVSAASSMPRQPLPVSEPRQPLWSNQPASLPPQPPPYHLVPGPGGPVPMGYWNPYAGPQLPPGHVPPEHWPYAPPLAPYEAHPALASTASTPAQPSLVLPSYTSSTLPRQTVVDESGKLPLQERRDSPRSVILTLSGAWGALSNEQEQQSAGSGSAVLSKNELLGYRRSADTQTNGDAPVLKALAIPAAR